MQWSIMLTAFRPGRGEPTVTSSGSYSNRSVTNTPDLPPSPGLHLHLATCYQRTNHIVEAQREYLAAADGFLKVSERQQAASAIRTLHSLGGTGAMLPDEVNRLKIIEETLGRGK